MRNHPHAHGDERLIAIVRSEIVDAGVATSAAIGLASREELVAAEVLAPDVAHPGVFDLASLTKPLTALCVARAAADGRLSLDMTVGEVLHEVRDLPAGGQTLRALLSHRAGLPAWGALYRRDPWAEKTPAALEPDEEPRLDVILRRAASMVVTPGSQVYSDIGYVLLGAVLERVGERLPDQWRTVSGIGDARGIDVHHIPPTELVAWRGVVRGEVHDENACMIARAGGGTGHAGAFATVEQVLRFGQRYLGMLRDGDRLAAELIAPLEGGSHALGWDLRSGDAPSSGSFFGPRTFGHLGFTGTSIWIDPDAEMVAVILTNRTYPTRANLRIRAARPRVHDAMVRALRPTSS